MDLLISLINLRTCNNRFPTESGRCNNIEKNLENLQCAILIAFGEDFHCIIICTHFAND